MSIFKNTFVKPIKDQLVVRQNAIHEKNTKNIHYLNGRNSWIRMSSSVNVDGSSELARQYVLKGGTLKDGKVRSGLGGNDKMYSNTSPSGASHRLGLRPMPGITGIDVRSKDAYGSLREVVVKFNCWDIKQLEDLELLYMRPGYTCLIEWGWAPYLNNSNELKNSHKFFDILDENNLKSKEQIFKELYLKSTEESGGNYDAMFGYVKNYNWELRDDGGYDCTSVIISVGEIIESLKVNYVPFKASNIKTKGILSIPNVNYAAINDIQRPYSINIMAGMFYELYHAIQQKSTSPTFTYNWKSEKHEFNFFRSNVKLKDNGNKSISNDGYQTYVTLESLYNLLNDYVLVHDVKSKTPLITLSTKERDYDKDDKSEVDLLCSAHPLQISIDPSICIIKSPLWTNGFELENVPKGEEFVTFSNNPEVSKMVKDFAKLKGYKEEWEDLSNVLGNYFRSNEEKLKRKSQADAKQKIYEDEVRKYQQRLKTGLSNPNDKKEYIVQFYKMYGLKSYTGVQGNSYLDYSAQERLNEYINADDIFGSEKEAYSSKLIQENKSSLDLKQKLETTNKQKTLKNLKYLDNLNKDYFYADPYSELGTIGNIYINLDYLYNLSLDPSLEQADRKDKNEINLYDFIKKVINDVQTSIGNVNHFEVHVDPIDNHARIIDVNYIDETNKDEVFNNAFELQVQNTRSIVRNVRLSSQIFPEQSSLVAIGAQFGGGKIGMENNTMIDFNKKITDRIIPEKEAPTEINVVEVDNKANLELLVQNFKILYSYFGDTSTSNTDNEEGKKTDQDVGVSGDYKNALRDVINYFQTITVSKIGKNKNIIPVKLSVELDGIGGLVIGHIFTLPPAVLPKGYKGMEGVGGRIGFALTGIGHKISDGDWITSLDAQTIILDSPLSGGIAFQDIMRVVEVSGNKQISIDVTSDVAAASITRLETQTNVKTSIKFFKGKGLTNEQTAGIIGNLLHESGLNPSRINPNDKGKISEGIAQWRAERRTALMKKYGSNYKNLDNQLSYLWSEMNDGEKTSLNAIKLSKTTESAAINFDKYFERSDGNSRSTRIALAKGVFNLIKKDENT